MPPVPKKKHPRSYTRHRRSRWMRLEAKQLVPCPNCGQPKLPHRVCPHCGYYKGREVVEGQA
ncbi:MAG: 50S ribosomal protein L32 [Chloroflexi bacterium]|nr:50S ribosomal protein L32 [Chloroflexota bacterium]